MIVAGLLLLFLGFRIKKIGFFLVWFFVGIALMRYIMPILSNAVPAIRDNSLWQTLLPIAGGLLTGLMGFTIEKICVGGIAFALVMMITTQYFGTEMQVLLIGGVIGVVAAGAATMLMKPAIIIATSAAGSYLITSAILFYAAGLDGATWYFPILIGIGAVGSAVQFLTTKRE